MYVALLSASETRTDETEKPKARRMYVVNLISIVTGEVSRGNEVVVVPEHDDDERNL
jgi:hypothetical protein